MSQTNIVRMARKRQGFSLRQVAAWTGIDAGDLSRIERGITTPAPATIHRLREVLGLGLSDISELLREADERRRAKEGAA